MATWKQTRHPGVRYREHATRTHGPRKQPDRYYAIRYSVGDGKRAEEGIGWASEGVTLEKAAGELARIKEARRTGRGPQSLREAREDAARQSEARALEAERAAARAMTVAEACGRYIAWAKGAKSSWRTDELYLTNQVCRFMGGKTFAAVNGPAVESFRDWLASSGGTGGGPLAAATVRNVLVTLRRLYNWAASRPTSEHDAAPLFSGVNPVKGLRLPKPNNASFVYFTREEAARVLEAAKTWPPDRPRADLAFHDACALALHTGLRKSELLSLDFAAVDLRKKVAYVLPEHSKSGKEEVVKLNRVAREVLKRRRKATGPGLVFKPQRDGARMRGLSHRFADLMEHMGFNAGVTDRRMRYKFHTWRHTFGTWLALAGVDIYRIKEMMRHEDITQTMRYAKLRPDDLQAAAEGLCD